MIFYIEYIHNNTMLKILKEIVQMNSLIFFFFICSCWFCILYYQKMDILDDKTDPLYSIKLNTIKPLDLFHSHLMNQSYLEQEFCVMIHPVDILE